MVQITNAHKGLAMGVLLIVVMAAIVAIIAILIITRQTDFISKVARYLGSLLTFNITSKLP